MLSIRITWSQKHKICTSEIRGSSIGRSLIHRRLRSWVVAEVQTVLARPAELTTEGSLIALKKSIHRLLAVLFMGVILSSIAPAMTVAKVKNEQMVVGVVQMVADLEWFRTVQMGIEQAAKDIGNVKVLVGNAQGRADQEALIVENYIARGVDAILISPVDSKASVAAIKAAQDAGIKVVIWNTMIKSPIMDNYIGTDNKELGAQAGRYVLDYVAKNLGGKAKIVIMSLPRHEVGVIRVNGFKEEIKKNPKIKVVAEQDGENPDIATNAVETILQAHPDVDLIWAANEGGIVGAINATNGRTDIKLIGTDMSIYVAKKLLEKNNGLLAISTQDPYNIGYVAMETAAKMVKGEPVPSDAVKEFAGYDLKVRRLIPLDMYTKDNPQRVVEYLEKYKSLSK